MIRDESALPAQPEEEKEKDEGREERRRRARAGGKRIRQRRMNG